MFCSIAVPTSPAFSSPSSLFCNNMNPIISPPSSPSSSCFRLLKPPIALPSPPSSFAALTSSAPSSSSPTNSLLKRKRPTRLDIPAASFALGAPATPSSVAARDFLESVGNGFSVYCKRGRREFMEDRYSAAVNLQGKPKQAFFGIFDGHGGAKAAEFAAHNLETNVLKEVIRRSEEDDDIEEAVKHGYLTTDSEFLKEDVQGGSCCVTALIRDGNLVVSNVGDCRAVICRGGKAEALTSDHRPSREDERDRIQALGGYVDKCRGVWRIQGSLAVSRAIGDKHLKQWVTAEPETKILKIEDQHDLLILASDGLWDKVSDQEAVDIARSLCVESDEAQPLLACKKLVNLSASRGSFDDISVMVIKLGGYI